MTRLTASPAALRWEKQSSGGWYAYSGELVVGMVVLRDHERAWVYDASNAVNMRWTAKGYGEVKTAASARRAVERAWAAWLDRAGLAPKPIPSPAASQETR